jgi:probable H4MPT-linked C1 transfer pathway protein
LSHSVLGLDIGGANLKAAHADGSALLQPFELWKEPARLADALRRLLDSLPPFDSLAVTMTGELCDCFESKRQGVNAILDAVEAVAPAKRIGVWQNDGRLVDVATARARPQQTAAANWLALATYAARLVPSGHGLLIDVGSTTTDIVPLLDGKPVPRGRTDPERLQHQELLYTGVRRTPLCALLGPDAAAELFATTLDVYLVLGKLFEDESDRHTADGRPATRVAAHARLARMLCADLETSTEAERRNLALRVCNRQMLLIRQAIAKVTENLTGPIETVIISGSGEFLALAALDMPQEPVWRLPPQTQVLSLATWLGTNISNAACAYALAQLATDTNDAAP